MPIGGSLLTWGSPFLIIHNMDKSEYKLVDTILDGLGKVYGVPFKTKLPNAKESLQREKNFKYLYLTAFPLTQGEFNCKKCRGTGRLGYREVEGSTNTTQKTYRREPCPCTFWTVNIDKILQEYEIFKVSKLSEEVDKSE